MSGRRPTAATLAALLAAALSGGCGATLSTRAPPPNAVREFTAQVAVHGESLTLHLASPQTPLSPSTPLVLYASGDGGWFGAAVGMFRTIAGSGLPTVGFSTKAFMRIEHRWSKPLSVAHVAEGYQRIIDAARAQLGLPPDAPVVLTGWSRGASLGVLVASQPRGRSSRDRPGGDRPRRGRAARHRRRQRRRRCRRQRAGGVNDDPHAPIDCDVSAPSADCATALGRHPGVWRQLPAGGPGTRTVRFRFGGETPGRRSTRAITGSAAASRRLPRRWSTRWTGWRREVRI